MWLLRGKLSLELGSHPEPHETSYSFIDFHHYEWRQFCFTLCRVHGNHYLEARIVPNLV